jgi:antibiotic biosynthesis monooxygenase (ABM) superfamily enzyme
MKKTKVFYFVGTRCAGGDDAVFNRWYDQVHIPMLLKCNKLTNVVRFKEINPETQTPNYVAMYEFACLEDFKEFQTSPERKAAIAEMNETWGKEIEVTSRVQYELIKEFKGAKQG